MLFLPSLHLLWWFGSHNLHKTMVDIQESLNGWLEEATLFLNEPLNALFNHVTSSKANDDVGQPIPSLPDLGLEGEGWLDEMVCILDYPNDLHNSHNEAEMLMTGDAASILDSLVDTNFEASYLPVEVNDNNLENDLLHEFGLNFDQCQAEISSDSSFSPAEHQPYSPISSVGSPASISDSRSECSLQSDSSVSVTVCNSPDPKQTVDKSKPLKISKVIGIDEFSANVKENLKSGGKIPSVHISLKASSHPYASAKKGRSRVRKEGKYERKKVQNKEAAARYRIKKREEEKVLSDEVSCLETEQKTLQEKHDQLKGEIKYLKSLMQEMFKAKGILK